MEITNFLKKMILLTNKEYVSYLYQENCNICEENFEEDANDKKYHRVRNHTADVLCIAYLI